MLRRLVREKDLFLDEVKEIIGKPIVYRDEPDVRYALYRLGDLIIKVSKVDGVVFDIDGYDPKIVRKLVNYLKNKKCKYETLETILLFMREK